MQTLIKRVRQILGTPPPPAGPVLRQPPFDYAHINLLLYFHRMMEQIRTVEGEIVECGVGGGTTMLILSTLVKMEGKFRKIWGFDSFEGFPEVSPHDASPRMPKKGDWANTSVDAIISKLKAAGMETEFIRAQISFVQGFFEESLSKYRGGPIALLHLDVDLYDSYKTCLGALYDRVAPGGVVLFDEYFNSTENVKWPGAAKAIDEFFRPEQIQRDALCGKFYHIKERASSP